MQSTNKLFLYITTLFYLKASVLQELEAVYFYAVLFVLQSAAAERCLHFS